MSTILSFTLVLLIGGTTYWGLGKATGWVTISQTQTLIPITDAPATIKAPDEKIQPIDDLSDIVEEAPDYEEPEEYSYPSPSLKRKPPAKKVVTYKNVRIVAQPDYYLQVAAFSQLEKAQTNCRQLRQKWNIPCKIGVNQKQVIAYKVLLGGFESMENTKIFQRKYHLKGFPRAKSFFEYIIE